MSFTPAQAAEQLAVLLGPTIVTLVVPSGTSDTDKPATFTVSTNKFFPAGKITLALINPLNGAQMSFDGHAQGQNLQAPFSFSIVMTDNAMFHAVVTAGCGAVQKLQATVLVESLVGFGIPGAGSAELQVRRTGSDCPTVSPRPAVPPLLVVGGVAVVLVAAAAYFGSK